MRPPRFAPSTLRYSELAICSIGFSSHSRRLPITSSAAQIRYAVEMQIHSPKFKTRPQHLGHPRKKAAAISIDLRILILRRQRVTLDTALAELYNVPVKRLNEQNQTQPQRFPARTSCSNSLPRENKSLKSQFATSKLVACVVVGAPCLTPSPSTVPSWLRQCLTLNKRWR